MEENDEEEREVVEEAVEVGEKRVEENDGKDMSSQGRTTFILFLVSQRKT